MADDTVDVQYLKRSHGERTRQGRCRGCRADFPCQSLLAAQEIERLTAEHARCTNLSNAEAARIFEEAQQMRQERDAALVEIGDLSSRLERTQARLAAVERERDEWGGKAATASAEASAFRRQRDELAQSIAQLTGVFP